ncbi:FAD:protein FMN transferase [Myxococcota bacterium]
MLKILTALILMAPAGGDVTVRQEQHMGTYVTITISAAESEGVLAAIEAGFAEVKRLENVLSEWRPDSQISAVNRHAGKNPVRVGREVFRVFEMALEVSKKSDGAFDVTFAALGGLWDYKAKNPRIPDKKEIGKRARLVDYRQLVLNEKNRSVMLKKAGMRTGLGGIAKGYVVDRVSAVLAEEGYPNHLVIAGGDLYASGTRGYRKWRIGIRDPKNRGLYAAVEVHNEGVATSGNYEKFFYKDGVRYHHILDPKTGWPARGTASVTVFAKSAAEADAWATALFVLGPEKALKTAAKEGLELFVFDEGYKTSSTPGMQKRIQPATKTTQPLP